MGHGYLQFAETGGDSITLGHECNLLEHNGQLKAC